MDRNVITLEEIVAFYEKYGIQTVEETECPSIPTAFEDIPLQYSNSTQNSHRGMRYYPYVIVPSVLKKLLGGKPSNVIHHTNCPKCVPYKEGD